MSISDNKKHQMNNADRYNINPAREMLDIYFQVDDNQNKSAQQLLQESENLHNLIGQFTQNRRAILRLIKEGQDDKGLIDPAKNPELQEILKFIEEQDVEHEFDHTQYSDPMDKLLALQDFVGSKVTSMQSEASMKFTKFHLVLLQTTELVRIMNDILKSQTEFIRKAQQNNIVR